MPYIRENRSRSKVTKFKRRKKKTWVPLSRDRLDTPLIPVRWRYWIMGGAGSLLMAGTAIASINRGGDCGAEVRVANIITKDVTNSFSDAQKKAVESVVEDVIPNGFKPGAMVSVYALQSSVTAPVRHVGTRCSPKRGRHVFGVFATPNLVEKSWQDEFFSPYKGYLEDAVSPEMPNTPFVEGVEATVKTARKSYKAVREITVDFITDGLQNTRPATLYGSARGSTYLLSQPVKDLYFRQAEQLKADQFYKGVNIRLHIVLRPDHKDRAGNDMYARQLSVMDFWEDYFTKAGAKSVSVEPVQ